MKAIIPILAAFMSTSVLADSESARIAPTPVYKRECGSCHTPFPPGLLGAVDWKKTMAGLEGHFGTDASLDAKTANEIGAWLARNAGRGVPTLGQTDPRITTSRWFVHEHDEVPARIWKDSRVKSPANCGACHKGADQGRYGERELSVLGMTRRERH